MRPRWTCRCAKCWSGTGPTRVAPPVTRDSTLSDWRSKRLIRSAGVEPHDLGGRTVDARATFPGGVEGEGLPGIRQYIRDHREDDFVRGFVSKLLAYALGRSLALSDDLLIQEIGSKLASDGYRFETVIESIVTSRQFLNKRGREQLTANER